MTSYVVTLHDDDDVSSWLVPAEDLHAFLELVPEPRSVVPEGMGLFAEVLPLEAFEVPHLEASQIAGVSGEAARMVVTRLRIFGWHHLWLARIRRADDALARAFFDRREKTLMERLASAELQVRREEFGGRRSSARMALEAAHGDLAAWRRLGAETWPEEVVRAS